MLPHRHTVEIQKRIDELLKSCERYRRLVPYHQRLESQSYSDAVIEADCLLALTPQYPLFQVA